MKSKHTVALYFSMLAAAFGAICIAASKKFTEMAGANVARIFCISIVVLGAIYLLYALFSVDEFHSVMKFGQANAKINSLYFVIFAIIARILLRVQYGVSASSLYGVILFGETSAPIILVLVSMILSGIAVFPFFLWSLGMLDFTYPTFHRVGDTSLDYSQFTVGKWEILPICILCTLTALLSSHILVLFALLGFILYSMSPSYRGGLFSLIGSLTVGLAIFVCAFGEISSSVTFFPELFELAPVFIIVTIILIRFLFTDGKIMARGVIGISIGGLALSFILSLILSGITNGKSIPERYEKDYILPISVVIAAILIIAAVIFDIRAYLYKAKVENKKLTKKIVNAIAFSLVFLSVSVVSSSFIIRGDMNIFNGRDKLPPPNISYTLIDDAYVINEGVRYGFSSKGLIALEVMDKSASEIKLYGYIPFTDKDAELSDKARELVESGEWLPEITSSKNIVYAVASGFLKDNSNVTELHLGRVSEDVSKRTIIHYFEDLSIENCANLSSIYLGFDFADSFDCACLSKNAFSLDRSAKLYPVSLYNTEKYYISLEPYQRKMYYLYDVGLSMSSQVFTLLSEGATTEEAPNILGSFEFKGEVFGVKIKNTYTQYDKWEIINVPLFSAGTRVKCPNGRSQMTVNYSVGGSFFIEKTVLGIKYQETAEFSGSGNCVTDKSYDIFDSAVLRVKNVDKHNRYFDGSIMVGTELYYIKDDK